MQRKPVPIDPAEEPLEPLDFNIQFRVTQTVREHLRRLARADRRSVSDMARILIEQGIVRRRPRVGS